ncbi:MAG: DUF58 domain-containing protein [Propionibacteriaceae bacterium]|jgi:uncharacterized protein (DUF58 family)|nr:DUF58 domain-containing protein [Propionibacteriaceae bacterium]
MTTRGAWESLGPGLAAGFGVGLAAIGLLLGRPDVAVVGAPLVLSALWALWRPPAGAIAADLVTAPADGPGGTVADVTLTAPDDADALRLRVTSPGHRPTWLVAAPGDLHLSLASVRTGPHATFHLDVDAQGAGGYFAHLPVRLDCPDVLTLPDAGTLGRVPVPPRLRGLAGPRTSRRPGDGLELRDVHPLSPGEPLRRIDWRATARQPSLDAPLVRGAYAGAEAVVLLMVDSRDDVGPDLRTWSTSHQRVDEASSLDLARHAAATVARACLAANDRVGLYDLAAGRRALAPATGRRQLRRLAHALALSRPLGSANRRVRAPQVPADAIVYLFSTLLDDEPVTITRTLTEAGHRVIVVDTLPVVRPVAQVAMELAWWITRLEREDRVAALRRSGVAVVRWAGRDAVAGSRSGRSGSSGAAAASDRSVREEFEALVRAEERGRRR